jgi:molybdopterin/thiamine biosynthesis adenylyltransferase
MSGETRYSRQEDLFGVAGQRRIDATRAGVLGVGGLGSFVAIELAYAGVGELVLVDDDTVGVSNLNRLLGAVPRDAERKLEKTTVAARAIAAVAPEADVVPIDKPFEHTAARKALSQVDVLFACVDNDVVRLAIAEFCCELAIPFFDLASDTGGEADDGWYGGRVLFSSAGERCPSCMDLLDQRALARAAMSNEQRSEDARIYGVESGHLEGTGPSVVSINGVVASLAVSEFIKWRTGLAAASGLLTYRADLGVVLRAAEDRAEGCFYCASWGSLRPGGPQYPGTVHRNQTNSALRGRRRGGRWGDRRGRRHAWKG